MGQLPVLIAGGGPAGLLLGQGLKKGGIPFRIFERDSSLAERAQGYRFRLTADGVLALVDCLTPEHFALVRAKCPVELGLPSPFKLDAGTGAALPGDPPQRDNRGIEPMCADRTVFRQVLARRLDDHIAFGKEITGYEADAGDESVTATFADGGSVQGAVLVAADGAWSKIRKQCLPNLVPVDSGVRWIYGKTTITPQLRQALDSRLFEGMHVVNDTSKDLPLTLLAEPMVFGRGVEELDLPPDYFYWVIGSRKDRGDFLGLGKRPSPVACVERTRKIVSDWYLPFKALFDLQDTTQCSVLRTATMKPPLPAWNPSRVVLIGDAAHCMMPTGGIGATTALRDAACLSKMLVQEGVTVESIAKYEDGMRQWADVAVQASHVGGVKVVGARPFDELGSFLEDED